MRRFLFLLSVIGVGFTVSDVQKEIVVLSWSEVDVSYNELNGGFFMSFKDAEFTESELPVPVYFQTFPLKNDTQEFYFVVENEVYKEVEIPEDFVWSSDISDNIQVKSYKLRSGDNFKIQLQIIPLKRNHNKLLLLQSFEIRKIPVSLKSAKQEQFAWKSESVLKSGKWIKISTPQQGIYKIPYSKLTEWGFNNPSKVNVFGSGGTILSEDPGEILYDDLNQNAVWYGKSEGVDCLFFYATGTIEWKLDGLGKFFERERNNYTTSGSYFLSEEIGNTKVVGQLPEITEPTTHEVVSFNAFQLYENELENVLPHGSGKEWYGEKFKHGVTKNINFDLTDLAQSDEVSVRVSAIARSGQTSEMKILMNLTDVGSLNFNSVNTGSQTSKYASDQIELFSTEIEMNELRVTAEYLAENSSGTVDDNATAWFDFIEVNYRRALKANTQPTFFRDTKSVGAGNIVEFKITGSSSATKVFDVTDSNNLKEVNLRLEGDVASAKTVGNTLREYVVFNSDGAFAEPEFVGEIENQNLHGMETPEFVIITHPNYLQAANNLANFHRSYDNMDVEVVTSNQVFNEFSSGAKDATGIRNFIKMFYDRDNGLKYVLLFGDGSYDNRSLNPGTKNFIPTFQSENSLTPVGSFVTDDYFVLLDNGESVYNGAVDLGIGRIPATTTFEADIVVDKILNYYSSAALGDWRNVVCFIGDDQDESQYMHMNDSEKLANSVNEDHPEFITDKIYLDAFVQDATPAGERYPDVTLAINKRVKDGALVLNYVGHANERFLADEKVLDISDINSWSNENNLPIFVTATCEFSRFDADIKSAGEYILFNPNGGGIGLFSTTRVVFASSNFLLSRNFYKYVFNKDAQGNHYRMGDIMRLAKINTINTTNKRNFSLLADPALKLSYPQYNVVTKTINQKEATSAPDTIGALQEITISGYVADFSGNRLTDFNGEIVPTVFDKAVMMETLGNGGYNSIQFKVQENIIHKGLASVRNGEFTFSFVVPKDISYNLGNGKILYYAKSNDLDANGAFSNFVIGSNSDEIVTDNSGPEIELFIDSRDFVSGGQTSKSPTLLAFLSDENGINTVGNGIGHDITAVLDDDYSNVIVLNNFYQSNLDDFRSGRITFPFQNLTPGIHTLKLKAWDVANNSTEVEIEFYVSGDFNIGSVSNYPNPFTNSTFFTFEHNHSDATLKTIIEIFDLSGRRVDMISDEVGSNGTVSNPVRWDINESGTQLKNGIYIYRITAQNNDGLITSKSGKMVVAR